MKPSQEFRLWARRAPTGERAAAAVATIIALALLIWLLAPGPGEKTTGVAAGTSGSGLSGAAPAATDGAGSGSAVTGASAGGGAANQPGGSAHAPTGAAPNGLARGGGAAGAGGQGCPPSPAGVAGVTATQMKVAIALTEIIGPAANSVFGIPSSAEQKNDYLAVIDDINRAGGIACRTVTADFYTVNPADQNQMHQQCLAIAASGVYAVLDAGGFAAVTTEPLTCFAQKRLPYFGAYLVPAWQAQQFYPYILAVSTYESVYRDTLSGLKSLGFFEPAQNFKKLGYFFHTCDPKRIDVFRRSLQQVVPDNQVVSYDFGCPTAFASPSDIQQAVLKFRQAGVTHVTEAGAVGDISNFTKVAEQQGFRPKYGFPDEALVQISYGNTRPDPNNMNGAVAITTSRNGENTTPGLPVAPGTVRCSTILAARHLRTPYEEPSGAGNACSLVWMFQATVNHAPSLAPLALGAGLQRTRSVEFSFPQGPNDFTADRTVSGGQFWRPLGFRSDCQCWRVTDPTFRPGFQ